MALGAEWGGLGMLAFVALGLILTGLPAFVVLIAAAVSFAGLGIATGAFGVEILRAVPTRITGLLESDILQALPLFVLMGALLDHLPLAAVLFRVGTRALSGTRAAPSLVALALGVILAPMSGSVGASVAALSRIVEPKLVARGMDPARALSTICVASTLGVILPPSLVLILLGDAMLRAHSEALNTTGSLAQAINTQDVFRGLLLPGAIFVALCFGIAWGVGRGGSDRAPATVEAAPASRVSAGDWLTAGLTLIFIVGLLVAVAAGEIYAVEGAAAGALALVVFGIATGTLGARTRQRVLGETMAVTGSLFALLVAATTFTPVFRAFGTDRFLSDVIVHLPGGPGGAVAAVLAILWLSAFVIDAFEIIFVLIPILAPPLLMRVPDAVWVSVLLMLTLQASFLMPPFGYAVMMAKSRTSRTVGLRGLGAALAPFLIAQLAVLGLTIAVPALTHVATPKAASTARPLSEGEVRDRINSVLPSSSFGDE